MGRSAACTNVEHDELHCAMTRLPVDRWCESCRANREVLNEDAANAAAIDYWGLRGISGPDF